MSKKSFLKGAAVLALAGVVVRIIGALYRIPLQNIIGVAGVGLYQYAYPVYGLLLTLSTAGIPGAISKMVSERMVHNDLKNARRVFHVSLILLTLLGAVSAAAMALGSGWVSRLMAQGNAALVQPSMLAAAPALFFVAVLTAYRGYFQGLQQMLPTAVSQIWEQVIKIIPGFFMAMKGYEYGVNLGAATGHSQTIGAMYGAAGAMWGVTLSEVVALTYLIILYAIDKKRTRAATHPERKLEPMTSLSQKLAKLALPMMAGAIFLPLASLADAAIVSERLTHLGYMDATINQLFGILSGMVNVLVNVPSVISLSLSTSMIPAIAESRERNDIKGVERKSRVGLKMAMLVSIPSAVGLAVLAEPILRLLFHGKDMTPEMYTIGGSLLAVSSISVIFLSIVQATNGALQGLGLVKVPMISLGVGALVKIVLNYTLIGIPEINIHGAPWGTMVCYFLAAAINVIFISRVAGIRFNFSDMLFRPCAAAAGMGAVAWVFITYLSPATGLKLATVLAVLVSIPVYFILAVLFGVIGREELSYMPGGQKLSAMLSRLKLLRD